MKTGGTKLYHACEFAKLAGVTVRVLHHYDRLGLLKPSYRSDAGYRLFSERDLVRLEQIVVLKFLRLPLKAIGTLLERGRDTLPETLRRQQVVLVDKRNQLAKTIDAIATARSALDVACEPDWTQFTQIIRRVAMQNDTDWASKYYSDEAKARVEERKALWSPELQARVTRDWNDLFRDVEAALGEDPQVRKRRRLRPAGEHWWENSLAAIRRSRRARTPCGPINRTGRSHSAASTRSSRRSRTSLPKR